jgi:sigma-B regulation protein RsbU (phosphoserine phosphatase)
LPAFEVGGDFYDFLNGSPNALTIIVGDVSGKGTSAALYMSKIQGILRTLNEFSLTPKQLLIRANRLLWDNMEKSSFITVLSASIDYAGKQITLARAGHMPLYYYNSRAGVTERIVPKGVVIGLSKDPIFDDNIEEIILNYNSGDVFLFVTDGVTEARNTDDEDYAETRLVEEFGKCIAGTSLAIRDRIVESVQEFSIGMEPFDDLTVVVVKAL